MGKRKTFEHGEAVEVVPEAIGRRRGAPRPEDWKPATYRHRGKDEMEGWHFVTCGYQNVHVPARRIRGLEER
jgi:hypothetical protein